MGEKAKIINEIAELLKNAYNSTTWYDRSWHLMANIVYERLIPAGFLLLRAEEYENYKKIVDGKAIMVENITDLNRLVQFPIEYDGKLFNDIADFGNYVQDQARKETAKEFASKVKECKEIKELVELGYIVSYVDLCKGIDEIAKQYGVEVEE